MRVNALGNRDLHVTGQDMVPSMSAGAHARNPTACVREHHDIATTNAYAAC